ncbi:hypothetical protein [Aquimarina muelleri]|uniref:Uncharacterized protein n=1 Tax=Aquimarina muelleri TaxID=279356 RepID=A0A918JSM9_9FLAO|nr:hypothetical protein [Aquimarina muelleri]MCX2763117.1 hypothetical protein [Aquimarina muelleri]GGX06528.1 hypothetical protein GCM10007384_05300 [Aquimarina muelleri]
MNKDEYLEKAIAWAEKKSTVSLRATHKAYKSPKIFTSKSTKEIIQADLSFTTHGGAKHYTAVALKEEDPKTVVVKWKVLSFMASMKRGQLHLLTPKGHKSFTEKLVNLHNINAIIHSI